MFVRQSLFFIFFFMSLMVLCGCKKAQSVQIRNDEVYEELKNAAKLPKDLMLNQEHLPLCVMEVLTGNGDRDGVKEVIIDGESWINIKDCMDHCLSEPFRKISMHTPDYLEQGYLGYEYIPDWDEDLERSGRHFYFCFWKYLKTLEDGKTHVIVCKCGTSTGRDQHSCVFLLRRNGDFVRNVKFVAFDVSDAICRDNKIIIEHPKSLWTQSHV